MKSLLIILLLMCCLTAPVTAMTQMESDEYNESFYIVNPVQSNIISDFFSSISSLKLSSIAATTSCGNLGFTETVKCEDEIIGTNQYTIAWGWTASTGQSGDWIYRPPAPWEFDSRYADQKGSSGSHGGCSTCIMTLVHLRAYVKTITCGDGTIYNNCSINQKPFYCLEGTLIEKASLCGCPEGKILYGDTCIIPKCDDGTSYNRCSVTKPLYCENGSLIDNPSQCGCPEGKDISGDSCITIPAPTQTPYPTQTPAPGFEAIFAIAGLLITAFLILRQDKT